MSTYKYPYVPREYYPAVMFACKMIRENGQFHRAINSSAKYYGVDAGELEKHVRARQGAGQKGKTRSPFMYYAVAFTVASDNYVDYDPLLKADLFQVVKATSPNNAKKQIRDRYDSRRYYGGATYAFMVSIEEFNTRDAAERKCVEWQERTKQ